MRLELKLAGAVLGGSALFAAMLLTPASTLTWWPAWILVALCGLAGAAMGVWLLHNDRDLLVERLKPALQPGQPWSDKVVISVALGLIGAWFITIPLDVFWWHVLPQPGLLARALGLMLVAASLVWTFLPLRENRYLTTAVRHQSERGHKVVDTGVYAIVRHPMYAGIVPFVVGSALWLGSTLSLLTSVVPLAGVIARLLVEEHYLRRELEGYDAYAKRVVWRLVPGLF